MTKGQFEYLNKRIYVIDSSETDTSYIFFHKESIKKFIPRIINKLNAGYIEFVNFCKETGCFVYVCSFYTGDDKEEAKKYSKLAHETNEFLQREYGIVISNFIMSMIDDYFKEKIEREF